MLNRLLSIALVDEPFVQEIRDHYSSIPCFANLRCGLWYARTVDGTCYFKSTDGHTHHWDFAISRLNLHVVHEASGHNGIMIIDSTRRGKRFPDSLTKTIPIWCCVVNRAVQRHRTQHQCAEKSHESWDTDLNVPLWIPEMEKLQIEQRIDAFVDKFVQSGVDLDTISRVLQKPLRCLWICPRTRTLPDLDHLSFTPLLLASASSVDYPVKSHAWTYIQGAADDQQEWSMGLTPELFWNNVDYLLEDRNDEVQCIERVQEVVQRSLGSHALWQHIHFSKSAHAMQVKRVIATNADTKACLARVGTLPLWIGSNIGMHDAPDRLLDWMKNNSVRAAISCNFQQHMIHEIRIPTWKSSDKEKDNDDDVANDIETNREDNKEKPPAEYRLLCTDINDDKRNKTSLQRNLDHVLEFAYKCLKEDKLLAILCTTGANESVAVCIAIMCQYFGEKGWLLWIMGRLMK